MTTKQIAEAVNKDITTVQRWIKRMNGKVQSIDGKMQSSTSTSPADYDLEETCAIIETGLGKNAANLYRENAKRKFEVVPKSLEVGEMAAGSSLTSRDLDLISAVVSRTVAMTIQQLDVRMAKIETRIDERQALLPAPAISDRDALRQLVNKEALAQSRESKTLWNELYDACYYRHMGNFAVQAKNTKAKSVLDHIDKIGMTSEVLAVALGLWGKSAEAT